MSDTIDIKPKNNQTLDIKPVNSQTYDAKPKANINDSFFNEDETVTSVFLVGHYMGIPSLTYTVAGTVTFTQPRGGRAG